MILPTFSLILIFGMMLPSASSMAASLYTPPNTGSLRAVMSRSPTPKLSTCAPWRSSPAIRRSSSALDTVILQSGQPASSSILRAFFVR